MTKEAPTADGEPLLDVSSLDVSFGPVAANVDVTVQVHQGEIVAVLGPNGAGKTTLLSTVMGLVAAQAGSVRFNGDRVDGLPPQSRVRRGLALVPEGRRVFASLTVAENLLMGGSVHSRRHVEDSLESIFARFPILAERRAQVAGLLSGGEQQQLVIGRALMSEPRLMLLDEPSLGLAPKLVNRVFEIITDLRRDGVSVLLVEQNARKAAAVADRIYVLGSGRVRTAMSGGSNAFDLTEIEGQYFGDVGADS